MRTVDDCDVFSPSEVHETVPRVIEEVIQRFNQAEGGGAGGGDGGGGKGDGGENAGARGDGSAGSSGARQPPEAAPQAHSRRTLEDVHGDGTTWNVNQRYNLSAAAISELWRRLRNVARKLFQQRRHCRKLILQCPPA